MLTDMMQSLIDGIGLLGNIAELLPLSPFAKISELTVDNKILGMLAWFVPFDFIVGVLESWLAAIVVWYIGLKILRWMKAIE